MKALLMCLLLLSIVACSKKPSLSSDDIAYVRTTLDLMRTRARMQPGADSVVVKSMLDTTYRRHKISKELYLKQTSEIGSDPARTDRIYKAINDSVGDKD